MEINVLNSIMSLYQNLGDKSVIAKIDIRYNKKSSNANTLYKEGHQMLYDITEPDQTIQSLSISQPSDPDDNEDKHPWKIAIIIIVFIFILIIIIMICVLFQTNNDG